MVAAAVDGGADAVGCGAVGVGNDDCGVVGVAAALDAGGSAVAVAAEDAEVEVVEGSDVAFGSVILAAVGAAGSDVDFGGSDGFGVVWWATFRAIAAEGDDAVGFDADVSIEGKGAVGDCAGGVVGASST